MDRNYWNERYRARELVWSAGPNAFVAGETSDLMPGRVLDLGAGEGRNAIWLAERGWHVTAIDFSDAGLEKARCLAASRGVQLDIVVADVTTYEPEPAAYDLVLVAYLQLPEPDLAAVLRHAVGAVAPGGTLLVVAHDHSNLECGYGGPQDPSVLTTPEKVATLVADLDVVKAERVERAVETPEGRRIAIDHVVRARRPLVGSSTS